MDKSNGFGHWQWRKWLGPALVVLLMAATLCGLLVFLNDSRPVGELHQAMQDRIDADKLPTEKQVRGTGLYWASLASVIVLVLLLVTCWWWMRPLAGSRFAVDPDRDKLDPRFKRAFVAALLAIVVIAGGLRWNLLSGSMWWDEAWALQNVYLGEFEISDNGSGELEFVAYEGDWKRALWRYGRPLNHPVASLLSQVAHSIWLPLQIDDPLAHEFEEWVLRLPAFLAGLMAIVFAALTVTRWGFPWAGLVAAALLALHPWAIRHTSEIRAYPFLLAGMAAALFFITRILQSHRGAWRNWIGLGMALLLLVWSHILSAPLALALCLGLVIAIPIAWSERVDRLRALARLAVVTLVAAGAFLMLFAPNIVQALSWAESYAVKDGNQLGAGAIGRLVCFLGSGLPWDIGLSEEADQLASVKSIFNASPVLSTFALLAFVLALALGWLLLWQRYRIGAWLLLLPISGSILTLKAIWLGDLYFYPRFLIYLLVPLAILFGIGATAPAYLVRLRNHPRAPLIGACSAIAVLTLFALTITPKLHILNRSSIEPLREVAQGIRDFEERHADDGVHLQVAGVGHGSDRVQLYFPAAESIRDHATLDRMTEEATMQGTHLLVFAGHRHFNEAAHPDLMATLSDESQFEQIAVFPGIETSFFYRLYRFRHGSALSIVDD